MTAQEKYEQWLEYAQYDLDTADAMYHAGRWLYVTFMCQQAVEKLVKGLYVLYIDDNVPRVHNIRNVISRFAEKLSDSVTDERYRLFDNLTSCYMNTRYPEYKQKMSNLITEKEARELFAQSKEVFAWLQTMKR
jgi:HEPN domain-containing protein